MFIPILNYSLSENRKEIKYENKKSYCRFALCDYDPCGVLRLYKEKILAYAESSESITDDETALSDAKATYLMDALNETDETATSKITVMIVNDGKTWQPQISSELANAFLGNIQGGLEEFNSPVSEE